MKYRFVFFLSIVLLTTSCTSIKGLNYTVDVKQHSVDELRNDVDFVYSKLKKQHPGIFWYTSKEVLDKKFDSLKASFTGPLKSREFYTRLAPVVASINCGHTRLLLVSKKYNKSERDSILNVGTKPVNQFSYVVKGSQLFIKNNNSEDSTLKTGTELLEIDGEPAAKIIANLERSISSDGYNTTFKEAVLNRGFSGWYNAFYGEKDSVNFKFQTGLSVLKPRKPKKITVAPKKLTEEEKEKQKRAAKGQKRLRYKGLDENKKPMLDLQFKNADSSIAYLKIKSFSFAYADFDKFYREAFYALKKAGTRDLIIDLRNNGGGSLKACRNLFAYLTDHDFVYLQPVETKGRFVHTDGNLVRKIFAPFMAVANLFLIKKQEDGKFYAKITGTKPLHPKANAYHGRVYVIVNGYSFSASTLFSANLVGDKRAIFVGEETGGGFNQCTAGQIPIEDLPNSKLKLRFGLYKIAPVVQDKTIGRGIFPDVVVKRTLEDELKNKDPEMDQILKLIKETK